MLMEKQINNGDEVNLGKLWINLVNRKLRDDAIAVLSSYDTNNIRSLSLGGNELTFEAIIDLKQGRWDNISQLYLRTIAPMQIRTILEIEDARNWPKFHSNSFIF